MNNNKKIDQIKKGEAIYYQLASTINKIEQISKPIKIDKKKLSILILIPFSIAAFLTAIVTFLTIDPYRWYTTDYPTYLVKHKEKITAKFKSFTMPKEFALKEKAKKVENIVENIKNTPDLEAVFASINERFNYDTVISIYDANKLLEDKKYLTTKTYQMKFNFVDFNIYIPITINVKVIISPF